MFNNSLFISVCILRDLPHPNNPRLLYRQRSSKFMCSHVPMEIFLFYETGKKPGNKKRVVYVRRDSRTHVFSWGSGTPLDSRPQFAPPSREHTRMGTSPTTFHPFYNQLPHRAYHLLWKAKKAHDGARRGLPSPWGEEWYALLHSRKLKTSLGKSNPPWCTPHFRNEKLRCM
jgi:hypothetical protein